MQHMREAPCIVFVFSRRSLARAAHHVEVAARGKGVTRAGEIVQLSPTEYKLLHYLLVNSGRVLSREQILDHVWSYDFGGDSSVVDTYISYLRRKLDSAEPRLIQTIRGVGFSLRVEP